MDTWITSVQFLTENFVKLQNFTNSLEFDGSSTLKRIKAIFVDDSKVDTLKAQLIFIAANFQFLPKNRKNKCW